MGIGIAVSWVFTGASGAGAVRPPCLRPLAIALCCAAAAEALCEAEEVLCAAVLPPPLAAACAGAVAAAGGAAGGAGGGGGGGGGGGAAPGAPVTQHGGNLIHTHTIQGGAAVGSQVAQAVVAEVVPAVNQAVNQAITGIQHDASGNHVPSQGTASNQVGAFGGTVG